jgi:hypothetical protein
VDAAAKAGASRTSGGDSGHQAGDSRDERGELGVSPALRGTKNVQRSGIEARHPATERQADMDRLASYDDGIAMRGAAAMRGDAPVAAATPPPVTEAARLSRTETSYVQAWMKASGQHR